MLGVPDSRGSTAPLGRSSGIEMVGSNQKAHSRASSGRGSRQNEIAELERCSASNLQMNISSIGMTKMLFSSDGMIANGGILSKGEMSPKRTLTPPPADKRGTRLARI